MNRVLLIDDEEKLRSLLSRILRTEGFEVLEAADGKMALKKLAQHSVDAILCDVKLPDTSGVSLVQQIKSLYPVTEIILLTAYGNIADGVQAIKNGAFDYITKGDDNEKIIPLLHRAIEKSVLQQRVQELEKRVNNRFSFSAVVSKSKSIREAISLAEKVAPLDTAVLLTGETGTGKEVFAQAIHQASPRASKTFVALNCSTFSKDILESELFGHKQGAFTGAVKDQKGLIEEANGGTLFLDEIGEMPLDLQAKLLRVLETNEFIRIGDTKPTKASFRLVAATNRDLKKESEEQRFRSDLYFRLNIFEIHLPPLRERVKDIPVLAAFFADLFAGKTNKKQLLLQDDFLEKLEAYHWPGNIRELKNCIERAVILANDNILTPELLPADIQTPARKEKTMSAFDLASVEQLHIQRVLIHTKYNKAETARLLNIGLATLYRKMDEYGL